MKIFDPKLTGSIEVQSNIQSSVTIEQDLTVLGSINGTFNTSTGTAISGAFTQDSSSLASRVTDLENFDANLDNTYATDAQVSTAVSALNAATSSYLQNTTDTLTGDLTVTGTITAQEFHTEFVSSSIIFSSGSTKFGDSLDDIHQFTGSVYISGSGTFRNTGPAYFLKGNVGIGTTAPTGELHIRTSNSDARITLQSSDGDESAILFGDHTDIIRTAIISDNSTNKLYFRGYNNANRMVIDSSGNVGIGTDSPSNKLVIKDSGTPTLEINGQGRVNSLTLGVTANESQLFENTNNALAFGTNAIERMRIDSGGDVYINGKTENLLGTGTSDGSDSKSLTLTSATDASSARGGYVTFYGNEHASLPGQVRLVAGNTTNAELRINAVSSTGFITNYVAGSERMRINSNGRVSINGLSNGADLTILEQGSTSALLQSTGGLFMQAGSATSLVFQTDGANERMRINSSGSIGIGTADPKTKLHIDDTADYSVALSKRASTASALRFTLSDPTATDFTWKIEHDAVEDLSIYGYSADNFRIWTNATERLTILSDGKVGIGTNTPAVNLDILNSSASGILRIKDVNATDVRLSASGNASSVGTVSNHDFRINSNNTPRITIDSSGNVGINSTSPAYALDVQGQIANRKGLLSAYGVYTDGGTYTNQWQKVFEISYPNLFAYAGIKLLVTLAGDTSNINMNAEVHINYKFQLNNGRIRVNIVNFGQLPLTTDDFEVYRDGTNTKLVFYHRVTRNYARPYYTILNNSDSSMSWSNTVVGASLSGEANDSFTEKNIVNSITAIPSTGNVGIGTTSPAEKLEVEASSAIIKVQSTTTGANANIHFETTARKWGVGPNMAFGSSDFEIYDYTAGSNRLVIDSSGNVGINTTTSLEKLTVNGNFKVGGRVYVKQSDSTSITPSNTDWVNIAQLGYGEHHGVIAVEWNGLSAPAAAHHGWMEIEVGTYYSAQYNYGWDTYLGVTKALAHNDFWFDEIRAVDAGSTVIIQVKPYTSVSAGSFRSYVLSVNQGDINTINPVVDATSYSIVLKQLNLGVVDGGRVTAGYGNKVRFKDTVVTDGAVGVNTTSIYSTFNVGSSGAAGIHLNGDSNDANNSGRLFFARDNGGSWVIFNNATNLSIRSGGVPGSTSGNEKIRLTGYSATSWTSVSDETLKENIYNLDSVLNKIDKYRCVEYNFIEDETNDKKIGFIAQDWQEDFPQLIEEMEDGKIGMKYTETIPILLKAIQELKAEIDTLKNG